MELRKKEFAEFAWEKELARLKEGVPTVPSSLREELDTNPFLRESDPSIISHLKTLRSDISENRNINRLQDEFKSTPIANSNKFYRHFRWKPKHDDLRTIILSSLKWEKKLKKNKKAK